MNRIIGERPGEDNRMSTSFNNWLAGKMKENPGFKTGAEEVTTKFRVRAISGEIQGVRRIDFIDGTWSTIFWLYWS